MNEKKEKEEEIICGPENIKTFNQQLKTEFPEFYPLVKALYKKNMIGGLRGAKIITGIQTNTKAGPTLKPSKIGQKCGQCSHFRKDEIGDGSGIGQCSIKARTWKLNMPSSDACQQYKTIE